MKRMRFEEKGPGSQVESATTQKVAAPTGGAYGGNVTHTAVTQGHRAHGRRWLLEHEAGAIGRDNLHLAQ